MTLAVKSSGHFQGIGSAGDGIESGTMLGGLLIDLKMQTPTTGSVACPLMDDARICLPHRGAALRWGSMKMEVRNGKR
jgi:hypothetical protein